jgi:subtilisin family serine protease
MFMLIQIGWAQNQKVNSEGNFEGIIRVKFHKAISNQLDILSQKLREGDRLKALPLQEEFTTGLKELDQMNQLFKAVSIRRIFRPAGKFEAKHKTHGLHLWYEIEFDTTVELGQLLQTYRNLKEVDITEPVRAIQAINGPLPIVLQSQQSLSSPTDDVRFSDQWHYDNTGQNGGTPDADISLVDAWSVETGSTEVIVAIEDGGIDFNHEDLAGNMWMNSGEIAGNGIDDDNNGYVDDIYGYNFADDTGDIYIGNHGTHVAGTVAAETNNGIGVAGVAGGNGNDNGIRLMSCNVFGSSTGGFPEAFVYAADNGAVISQNSWSYTYPYVYEQAVLDAIDYFIENAGGANSSMDGGLVVFAAGNNRSQSRWYPAFYSKVMAVASTNKNDQKASYSNYGSWVDISAPGGEMSSSSDPSGVHSTLPNNKYGLMQGTSMACPHVSGVAALVVSKYNGNITAAELWNKLVDNTDNIDNINGNYAGKLGSGRLNAYKALTDDDIPSVPQGLTATNITHNSFTLNWNSVNGASSYDVQIRLKEGNWESFNLAENSYSYTEAIPETIYEFRVRANNEVGSSAYTSIQSVTTDPEPTPPAIPTNLSATGITHNSFTISWDEMSKATSYDLQIREQGYEWSTYNTASNNYNYTGAKAETTYEFRVRANNDAGSSDYTIIQNVTTEPEPTPPAIPTNLSASNITHNSFSISWDPMNEATSYDLQIREQGYEWSTYNTVNNTFDHTGAKAETTYEFRVRANNDAGSGDYTTIENLITDPLPLPSTPSGLSASNISSTSFTIQWEPTEYADSYDIQIREQGDAWADFSTTATKMDYTSAQPSTTYDFRVRAVNNSGASEYTPIESVTTLDDNPTPEYCVSKGNSTRFVYIDEVALADLNNKSGDNGGYGDFTQLSTSISPGKSYTISFSAGYKSWNFYSNWKIWIDFNRNGNFESSEEIVSLLSRSSSTLTETITIPSDAVIGTTRMRVSLKQGAPQSPCQIFSYGEVEDYSLNISNASSASVQLANSDTPLGSNEFEKALDSFSFYPNPAQDQINIQFNGVPNTQLHIQSITGKTIRILNLNRSNSTVDISDLPSGIYLLSLIYNNTAFSKKLIVK